MIKFGSVCSGIESASVAWEPLGLKASWFSEIEPFPCTLLKHRYPDVFNYGDMNQLPELVKLGVIDAPEILVGGTPCQAFSVAGSRKGLSDERGQLTLTYVELLNAIDKKRPNDECVAVWENVPGVLNTIPINTMTSQGRPSDDKSPRMGSGIGQETDPQNTLSARHHHAVSYSNVVRRLTPTECERLQGFPDGYTKIPYRKKDAEHCPDGPRYKALGNSKAVPCIQWVGVRVILELLEHD